MSQTNGMGVSVMRWIWVLSCSLLLLMGCQRAVPMEKRQGLANDSRSYSFVSYPADRMKQAALNVKGVKDVSIHYNGKELYVDIIPKKQMDPASYPDMVKKVEREVKIAAPLNPVHVRILHAEHLFSNHRTH